MVQDAAMPLAQGPSPSPDPCAAVRRLLADATVPRVTRRLDAAVESL